MKLVYVEGFGCSLNLGATEKIRALLKGSYGLAAGPEKAHFILINTCAVKTPTETHMLRRIRELGKAAERNSSQLAVSGCLPLIAPGKVLEACPGAKLLGTGLGEIAEFFKVPAPKGALAAENLRSNPVVAIIPIATGCLGSCAYCCVKNARGKLKSHSPAEIESAFTKAISTAKEIWLTANDTGCYGFDLGTNLAELLERLLKIQGDYRIRIGMMNPGHLENFFTELLKAMEDPRVYKFLHIPVQSGSDRILSLMERNYSVQEFKSLAREAREKFPGITISTDIIAGFPGESESDFNESLELIEWLKPDIVNVSRFGLRPNTKAESMKGKVHGRTIKERTRKLSALARGIALERNKALVGREERVLVSEKGKKGGFVARTNSYKPVVLKRAEPGKFYNARVEAAFQGYLSGEISGPN